MNKKIIIIIAIFIVLIGGILFFVKSKNTTSVVDVNKTQPTSNNTPLVTTTPTSFSQYKYFNKAHEIFPVLAADTKQALGAFSYKQDTIGNNTYKFTLTNNSEGYKGQSVTVTDGQTLYFIEPSLGDDSTSEDSVTTDDFFIVVDAQGNILQ